MTTPAVTDEAYFKQMQERADRARAALGESYPESWTPEPGDTLVGEILDTRIATMRDGDKRRILIVGDIANRKKVTVWMSRVLLSQFQRLQPKAGDVVAIRYEGKKAPEGGGNEYHNFTVSVDRPKGAELAWGDPDARVGGSRETDAAATGEGLYAGNTQDADFQGGDDSDIPF